MVHSDSRARLGWWYFTGHVYGLFLRPLGCMVNGGSFFGRSVHRFRMVTITLTPHSWLLEYYTGNVMVWRRYQPQQRNLCISITVRGVLGKTFRYRERYVAFLVSERLVDRLVHCYLLAFDARNGITVKGLKTKGD